MSFKKNKCEYCGDSPVNHRLAYISQTIGVYFEPVFLFVTKSKIARSFLEWLANSFQKFFYFTSIKMQILHYGKNKADAVTGRSRVIWDEAEDRGIVMRQVVIYGKPIEQYRAKINNKWEYFESLPIPKNLPSSGYDFIDDKVKLKDVLNTHNICVPKSISVSSKQEAIDAFNKLNKPVIVKPRIGSRGRHTTVYINTVDELVNAYNIANQICKFIAIEEYLIGPVCRATVVNNKLVGYFVAYPPMIVGDGIHTVTQLINIKNSNKPERVEDIIITKEATDYLARQGYTADSVLPNNIVVNILSRTGRYFGGETFEMINDIHPKLRDYIERATKAVVVPVVGFDVIIPDPKIDPDTQKWGIIEANSLPFIDLHYYPLHGSPVNIASYIWDLWK